MSILNADPAAVSLPVLTRVFEEDFIARLDERLPRLSVPGSAEEWNGAATTVRKRVLELFAHGHPSGLLEARPAVEWGETLKTGAGYTIRKLRYEGYPGMWIPALVYMPEPGRPGSAEAGSPKGPTAMPAVLNTNGHHIGGKAMAYKQARCINLAKRGIIALNTEFIGMGQLSACLPHNRLAYLDACGVSGVGVFYCALKRGLDVLLSLPETDADRVAVTGLSGGGWQTAVLSALDTRVRVSVPVAGHSPVWQRIYHRCDIGDMEQVPPDLCTITDYDFLTAMIAPRPLLLMYNRYDNCCFQSERTRRSVYEPAREVYELLGVKENIEFHENVDPGTHNYEVDNRRRLYRFLGERFGLETVGEELPWRSEIMTEAELAVDVPPSNATLLAVALDVSRPLRGRAGGTDSEIRMRVTDVIRRQKCNVTRFRLIQRAAGRSVFVERGALETDCSFDVPVAVVESDDRSKTEPSGGRAAAAGIRAVAGGRAAAAGIRPVAGDRNAGPGEGGESGTSDVTGLVLSDNGRPDAARSLNTVATGWRRAVCPDIFGTGESALSPQYEMVLSGVGGRTIGMQVAQIIAVLKWVQSTYAVPAVPVVASGHRVATAALIACVVEPGLVSELTTEQLPSSFHDLIEHTVEYDEAPSLYCPGLFAAADVPGLLQAAGIPVRDSVRGPLTRSAISHDQ